MNKKTTNLLEQQPSLIEKITLYISEDKKLGRIGSRFNVLYNPSKQRTDWEKGSTITKSDEIVQN